MNAGEVTGVVVNAIEAKGLNVTRQQRSMFGAYSKRLIEAGATDEQLKAWAEHYGSRIGEGAKIKPSQAWEDVNTGEAEAVSGGSTSDWRRSAPTASGALDALLASLTPEERARRRRHQIAEAWCVMDKHTWDWVEHGDDAPDGKDRNPTQPPHHSRHAGVPEGVGSVLEVMRSMEGYEEEA
jgi:hypothetical protein